MAYKSAIEWTDATWNPFHGCHKISAGCKYCYMFRDKARYGQDPNTVVRSGDKTFYAPLKWKEPRLIFTCSWSDFFIEESDAWRDEAFAIMALTPQHTYQVLTKRPERMLEYLRGPQTPRNIYAEVHYGDGPMENRSHELFERIQQWPLPNVWLGVSVEDRKTADERIPKLLQTPAAVRWLSLEPLLGPVDLRNVNPASGQWQDVVTGLRGGDHSLADCPSVDWVVVGGESGPDARPMHPDWVRSIRDQCQAAKVPFFFKQWGEWAPSSQTRDFTKDFNLFEDGSLMYKIGKKKAGRLLDGRKWNEFPTIKENIDAARA
ncbi:MAG: DUF5131 family protein [Hyphomonadaceae bacterium]